MDTEVIPLPHEAHSMPAPKMAYNAAHLKARAKETHAKKMHMKKMAPKKGHKKMVPKKVHKKMVPKKVHKKMMPKKVHKKMMSKKAHKKITQKGKRFVRKGGRHLLSDPASQVGNSGASTSSTGINYFHNLKATNKECYSDDFDVFSGVATREECELKSCAGKSGYDYNAGTQVCRVFNGALGAIDVVHTHVQDTVCYEQIVNPATRQRCPVVTSTEYTTSHCGDGSTLEHGEICEVNCMFGKYAVGRLQCSDGVMSGTPTCRANNEGASSHTITFSDTLEFKSNGQICVDISLNNMDDTSLVQIGIQNVLDSDSSAELVSNSQFYEGHTGHCSNYDSAAGVLYPAIKLRKDDMKAFLTSGRSASGDLVEGGCNGENFLGLTGRDSRFTRLSCSNTGNGKFDAVVKYCNTLDKAESCSGIGTTSALTERREETLTTDRTYFSEKVCVGVNSWERGEGTTDIVKQSSCTVMSFYLDHKHGGFVDSSSKTLDIDYGCELKIRDTKQLYAGRDRIDGADVTHIDETGLEVTYSLHCPQADSASTGGVKFVAARMENSLLNTAVLTAKERDGAVTDTGSGDGEVSAVPALIASGHKELILTVTTPMITHGTGANKDAQELITAFGTQWGMVITFQRSDCTATNGVACETKDRYYAITNSRTSSPMFTSVTSVDGMEMRLYKNAFPYWSDPSNYNRANLYSWTQKQLFEAGDQIVTGDTLTIVQQVATVLPHSTAHIDRVTMFTDAEQCAFVLDQAPHGTANAGARCHPLYDNIFGSDALWNEMTSKTANHGNVVKNYLTADVLANVLKDYHDTQCNGTPTAFCPCTEHINRGNQNRMGRCRLQFYTFFNAVDLFKDGISQVGTHAQTKLLSNELRPECIEKKPLIGCDADDEVLVLKNDVKGKDHCIASDMVVSAQEVSAMSVPGVTRVTADDVHRLSCTRQYTNRLPQSVGDSYDASCSNDRAPLLAEVVIGAGVMQSYRARRVRFYVTTKIVNEFADDCAQWNGGVSDYTVGGDNANGGKAAIEGTGTFGARRLLSAPKKKIAKKPQGRKLLQATNNECTSYCAGDKACCESPDMHKDGLVVCKWDPDTTAGCVMNTEITPAPPPASTTTSSATDSVPVATEEAEITTTNVKFNLATAVPGLDALFKLKADESDSELIKALIAGMEDATGISTAGSPYHGKVTVKANLIETAGIDEFYVEFMFSATPTDIATIQGSVPAFAMNTIADLVDMHPTARFQSRVSAVAALGNIIFSDVLLMQLYALQKKCKSSTGDDTLVANWQSQVAHLSDAARLQKCLHACCAGCHFVTFVAGADGSCTTHHGSLSDISAIPKHEDKGQCWERNPSHHEAVGSRSCTQDSLVTDPGVSKVKCDYLTAHGNFCIPQCAMGKEPVGHWMCNDGQWTQPADHPKASCQPIGKFHKPKVASGTPFFKVHDTTTNTNVDLCIALNITDLPSNSLAVIDWRNSGDSDHHKILTKDPTSKVHSGNNLCSNYNTKSAPWHDQVKLTDGELKKLLSTGLTNEGTYEGGQCGGNTYLSPFPRDGRHEFSQDYCHYDNVKHTTDRDVVVCSTLTELEMCPSYEGTANALTSKKVNNINGKQIEKFEYDTKLCFSTVSLGYSEHPKDTLPLSEHSWCQTIEFEHVTSTRAWTVKGVDVDFVCELKLKKLFPVIHTTDSTQTPAVSAAQLKFEATFQCPKVPGGSNAITLSDVAIQNTDLATGGDLSYDSTCDASAGPCLITFTSVAVPKDGTVDVLHTHFGGASDINAAMTITTNNGATDHKAVHALSFNLPVSKEKVEVKKSSITVETFHEINNGDETDASALASFKTDVTKVENKQLGTGDELVVRVVMTDTAPLTSSYIYNAGLFLAEPWHPMYNILVNGNEALWHSLITSKTTNYQGTDFWAHSEEMHTNVLSDYYQTNCEDAYSSTLCPCTDYAQNTVQTKECKKRFINGVYWVDLVKEGVLQTHDESKFKSETTTAACLEELPLASCDAGTSGNYLNVKDTATCSTGYTMETTTHQLAAYNGEDLSSAPKALARACKVAKGLKASSKSFLGASTQCDAIFKQTTVELIIGSSALASFLKGTGKDLRKFHTYVEVANIQYYTHGCDAVLASSGRRLLQAAGGVGVADVNKVIGAAEVKAELVAVQKQLDELQKQIDVPKDSYNSATAKLAYASANADVKTLKENYEALRNTAENWKASATALGKEKDLADSNFITEQGKKNAESMKKNSRKQERDYLIVAVSILGLVVLALGVMLWKKSGPSVGVNTEQASYNNPTAQGKVEYKQLFRQAVDL